jgi:hypothetical protein
MKYHHAVPKVVNKIKTPKSLVTSQRNTAQMGSIGINRYQVPPGVLKMDAVKAQRTRWIAGRIPLAQSAREFSMSRLYADSLGMKGNAKSLVG